MSAPDFIHHFVPAKSGSARVLLLLHGTGGDESDLLPLGAELDPNAALLSPRGRVTENGMPRFFRRFAEGVFDEEDVIRRANELADFIIVASGKYRFEEGNVTAVGYSNGANIAAAIMLLRPGAITGGILLRAMVPLSQPPVVDLSGTRVLISAGAADPIIPRENAERLAGLLRERGSATELIVQQAGHQLVQQDVIAARQWLAA